jgi:hypothetical protein
LPSSASWARTATGLAAALLTCGPAAAIGSAVLGTVAGPQPAGAAPAVPAEQVEHVDPQTATAAEVAAELARLDAEVAGARTAAADADAALVDAQAELDAARARAARLRREAEAVERAQARHVDPPTTDVFEMLGRPLAAAPAEQARGADTGADRSAASSAAVADARAAVDEASEASTDAERERDAAELAELVTAAQARGEARRAEADQLAWTDPASADRVRADEATIAGPLVTAIANQQTRAAEDAAAGSGTEGGDAAPAAAAPAAPAAPAPAPTPAPAPVPAPLPDPAGSASGALEGAWCADGRRVVVDATIGLSVQFLINDAAAAGIGLCGRSGFRSYAEQAELRRQNCGSSDYALYVAPPSTCSPPTARPGMSNHEDGLAIDFDCADGQRMTHASPCYQWLAANASRYGLYNLPSEPWHWSVTGR